jgi:hypothetical protein
VPLEHVIVHGESLESVNHPLELPPGDRLLGRLEVDPDAGFDLDSHEIVIVLYEQVDLCRRGSEITSEYPCSVRDQVIRGEFFATAA